MRRSFASLVVLVPLVIVGTAREVAAQGDGPALCQQALAAAGGGASAFQGYEVVRAPDQGGSGRQVVLGTAGADRLSSGSGDDLLCGFGGDDQLDAGSGNDIVVGGPGADRLSGGSGDDTLHFDSADTAVDGGSGRNTSIASPDTGTLSATFRLASAERNTCYADVRLSEFAPGSSVDVVTYTALDASGSGVQYNQTFDVLVGADGSAAFADFSLNAGLFDGRYYQARVGDAASPWSLMDCL